VEQAVPALRVLRDNLATLGAADRAEVVKADAVKYAAGLDAGAFDVAFADPPYGQGFAAAIVQAFAAAPFAGLLCVEHGRADALPDLPGARTRRYGDTQLTFIPAPE
jgi:16S rRNA (guanine966-N2)-methyltransferase